MASSKQQANLSKAAVFLDRDGTINVDKGYVHRIEDFEFIPGAVDGLKMLHRAGFLLVIVTNQSGIARGIYSEEDYRVLEAWLRDVLADAGVTLAATYHCPHFPKSAGECDCRKPKLGMFNQAIQDLDIDLSSSWAVGDNVRDLAVCRETLCRGVLVGQLTAPEGLLPNNCVCRDNLLEAACYITGGMRP